MEFMTDRYAAIGASRDRPARILGNLRADMNAKAVWFTGATSRGRALRMLMSDGSFCTVLYRSMAALRRHRLGPLAAIVCKLNAFLTGAVIGSGAEFGPGLIILHSLGLVINKAVRGGVNVVLEGGVTLGAERGISPVLGDHVFVGTGAKVLGGVRVGNRVRIGANAVVVKDVPDDATAVGVPARVVRVRGESR